MLGLPQMSESQKFAQYNHYATLVGAFTSSVAIILLFWVLLISNNFDASYQSIAALGVFGLFCGIIGSIMPLIHGLQLRIKRSQTLNTVILMLATCCWFITAILWICIHPHIVSFCGFFVSVCYLLSTAFKIKANVYDDFGLEQSINI